MVWYYNYLFTAVLLVAQCWATPPLAAFPTQKDLNKAANECTKNIAGGWSTEDPLSFFNRFPENEEENREMGCASACILAKLDYMTGDKLEVDKIAKALRFMPGFDKTRMKDCMNKVNSSPTMDKCNVVLSVSNCYDVQSGKNKQVAVNN